MKKKYTVLLAVFLIAATVFTCVGYAALTTSLSIFGTAYVEGKPYKGVYIKDVEVVSTSGANSIVCDYILPTNYVVEADASRTGGSVTYKITFHNNTDVTYWYIGQKKDNAVDQNILVGQNNGITVTTKDQLSDSYSTFNTDDWIPPQTERVVYVTYSYGSNAQSVCSTMINYHFDIRMDAVHDEFLAVLNNIKAPDSYEYLTGVFDTHNAQTGGVTITTESHPEVFANLFEDLVVNIDGQERQASVVIRRENIDRDGTSGDTYGDGSPSGCEYTLYITVEGLTPGSQPTVYAIAYSRGTTGMGDQWYQVGELYEGTAPVKADGTIDYANWVATTKTYEVADNIYYNVAQKNGDQYDLLKTMEQLISTDDQDIFNDIDNTHIFKKVYDILQQHQYSTDPAVLGLREVFEEISIFYNNLNNGQEFKVVRNTYTRAEIIPAIKKLQKALDYYYQAYPGN